MTGSVTGIRRRRTVAGRRETSHLPPDRAFYGQTLIRFHWEKSRLKKKTAAEGTEKAVYKPTQNRGETLGTEEVIDESIRRAARLRFET